MEQTQEHIAEATQRIERGEYGEAAKSALFSSDYHGVVYEGGHLVVICLSIPNEMIHVHYDEGGALIRTSGCWCKWTQEVTKATAPPEIEGE